MAEHDHLAREQRDRGSGAAQVGEGRPRRISSLVGGNHRAGPVFSRRPAYRVATDGRRRILPGDESEQQLFLRFDGGARIAPAWRNLRAPVCRLAALAQADAGHSHRSGLALLAFHGWALGVPLLNLIAGTVKIV